MKGGQVHAFQQPKLRRNAVPSPAIMPLHGIADAAPAPRSPCTHKEFGLDVAQRPGRPARVTLTAILVGDTAMEGTGLNSGSLSSGGLSSRGKPRGAGQRGIGRPDHADAGGRPGPGAGLRHARPLDPRRPGARHGGPLAHGPGGALGRLGVPSGARAGQAMGARAAAAMARRALHVVGSARRPRSDDQAGRQRRNLATVGFAEPSWSLWPFNALHAGLPACRGLVAGGRAPGARRDPPAPSSRWAS